MIAWTVAALLVLIGLSLALRAMHVGLARTCRQQFTGEVGLEVRPQPFGLTIDVALELPSDVQISSRVNPRTESSFLIGDPEFDRSMVVRGPAHRLAAGLTPPVRAALKEVIGSCNGRIRGDGVLRWFDRGSPEKIVARIRAALDAKVQLEAAFDPSLLEERALTDPDPEVRLAALRARADMSPETFVDLAERASNDADARVRVFVAGWRRDPVPSLQSVVVDEEVDPQTRMRALTQLGRTAPALAEDRARVLMLAPEPLRAIAVRLVSGVAVKADVPALVRVVGDAASDASTVQFAATALADVHAESVQAEAPLLEAFDRSVRAESPDPILIQALGKIGTSASIAALQNARKKAPSRIAQDLQRAADQIRARLGGGPGRVSLAPVTGGEVALEDSAGALTESEPERKR